LPLKKSWCNNSGVGRRHGRPRSAALLLSTAASLQVDALLPSARWRAEAQVRFAKGAMALKGAVVVCRGQMQTVSFSGSASLPCGQHLVTRSG